jgi:L-lactate dehydrogenase complex protein LldF
LADTEQREVLHCIRCGACLNACPVYRNIGGHTYNTVYPGPIGSVLTPHLRGLAEFQHLSYASSLCGNCNTVCPVKIDLSHHLLQNRRNAVGQVRPGWRLRLGMRLWRWSMMDAGRFRLASRVGKALLRTFGGAAALKPWTEYRDLPPVPEKSFRQMWRQNGAR